MIVNIPVWEFHSFIFLVNPYLGSTPFHLLRQSTPALSPWPQLWTPHPLCGHSEMDNSSPLHLTSSNQYLSLGSLKRPLRITEAPIYKKKDGVK